MRLMQIRLPIRAAGAKISLCGSLSRLPQTRQWQAGVTGIVASNTAIQGLRFASVKAQGAYKLKNKKTLPKKMGAKRVGDQYVLSGTIIYKQRGTIWHAGENTILGRDHTIHAAVAGYVKYYRDPEKHPDRQYIGVTFKRDDALPYPSQAARKRRLGMVAIPRKSAAAFEPVSKSGIPRRVVRRAGVVELPVEASEADIDTASSIAESTKAAAVQAAEAAANEGPETSGAGDKKKETKATRAARRWNAYVRIKRTNRVLFLGKNYGYRESNVEIGRLMGKHKGKTPGTQRLGSRRGLLRHRRKKREELRSQKRELMLQQRNLSASNASAGVSAKKTGGSPKKAKAGNAKKAKGSRK